MVRWLLRQSHTPVFSAVTEDKLAWARVGSGASRLKTCPVTRSKRHMLSREADFKGQHDQIRGAINVHCWTHGPRQTVASRMRRVGRLAFWL